MSVQIKVPVAISLHQASRVLELSYADGEHYCLGCEYLRVYSPSAEVRGHGAGQETLQTGKPVAIERIKTVGNYALQFHFSTTATTPASTPGITSTSCAATSSGAGPITSRDSRLPAPRANRRAPS